MIEVEQKFPLADASRVERALADLGADFHDSQTQTDEYFAHPSRDFAQTDEALRIRHTDQACCITYKGPKLDQTTKTRQEIELPLAAGLEHAEQFSQLLAALGFSSVTEVRKQRRLATVDWRDRRVEVALDDVEHVGNFVELELLVTREDEVADAKACLAELADRLGLKDSERRSYLELLLASRAGKAPR